MAGYHIIVRTGFGIHGLTQHQEAEWGGGRTCIVNIGFLLSAVENRGLGGGNRV